MKQKMPERQSQKAGATILKLLAVIPKDISVSSPYAAVRDGQSITVICNVPHLNPVDDLNIVLYNGSKTINGTMKIWQNEDLSLSADEHIKFLMSK